jgi:TonB family protein
MLGRRGSKTSLRRVPLFVALSIAGHVAFTLVVSLTGLGRGCGSVPNVGLEGPPPSGPEAEHADLLCVAEELLMTGGRTLACIPGSGRVDRCAAEAVDRLYLTSTACRESRPIDVTMIEPMILNPFAERPTEEQAQIEMLEKLEEAKKPEENPDQNGQVVDVAKPEVEVRPDDSEFLAEYDSKVEKQTKAPNAGEATRPQPPPPPTPPQEQPKQQPPQKGAGALAMRSPEGTGSKVEEQAKQPGGAPEGRPVEDKDGYGPRAGDGNKGNRSNTPAESPGAGNGQPLPSMSDLRPSEEQISRAVGGPGSIDSLKDIDEGATTQLNTKRFKYATFFNRVKHAVAQQWHPDDAYRLRDPTGQIYGIKSRRTIVRVSLKPDGNIRDLLLEHPCGVDFLDDEALSALREAGPFPNPPAGLVDKTSGLITFRFEFNFEVYDAPTFKVFRYQ